MPFFEPLPPPPPELDEARPTGWRPPIWDRPSEATLGAPVPITALLAKTDRLALALSTVLAYPNGFTFELLIQRNPMAPRAANEYGAMLFMGPPHQRQGPRVGFEFADGSRVTQDSPMPFPGRSLRVGFAAADEDEDDSGIPSGPLLVSHGGGGGSHDRFEMKFWCYPLPPPGPMKVFVEWVGADIAESSVVVDATLIVAAAPDAIIVWEPDADD